MRSLLAALSLLVAVVMLYQGLALGGIVGGSGAPHSPETGTFLLIAGVAMLIAGTTLHKSPGIAAIEMALAGFVTVSLAEPAYRYLAAYGTVAVLLALATMAIALLSTLPSSPRHRAWPPCRAPKPRDPSQDHYRQLLFRIDETRARRPAPIQRKSHRPLGRTADRNVGHVADPSDAPRRAAQAADGHRAEH